MAEKEYIEREAFLDAIERMKPYHQDANDIAEMLQNFPAADVRPVTVCTNCEHNNHCLTQEFVEDCGKIPLDRNTFFCADGERRNNA